ncbi:MAG: HAD family hydrolase [Actinomycetota bacterium]
MIEMVVFDADQTLWDFRRGMRRSLANRVVDLQQRFPTEAAELDVEALVEHRRRVADEHPGAISMADVRRFAFGFTVASIGVEDPDGSLVDWLCERFFAERLRPEDLFDDTLPMLDALHDAGLRTAVLTNGNADLVDADLQDRFELIVRAPEHGVAKPDVAAYRLVEERVGLQPAQLAMVGDDVGPDVHGARAAGWTAIWLTRDGAPVPDGPAPHHVVRSLAEVPALVA